MGKSFWMSNPHPGVSGPLALLCLADFYASDMNWPLLLERNFVIHIFRIKESPLVHEIGCDWGAKHTFWKDIFSKVVQDLFLMQGNGMCRLTKHKEQDVKAYCWMTASLTHMWNCIPFVFLLGIQVRLHLGHDIFIALQVNSLRYPPPSSLISNTVQINHCNVCFKMQSCFNPPATLY